MCRRLLSFLIFPWEEASLSVPHLVPRSAASLNLPKGITGLWFCARGAGKDAGRQQVLVQFMLYSHPNLLLVPHSCDFPTRNVSPTVCIVKQSSGVNHRMVWLGNDLKIIQFQLPNDWYEPASFAGLLHLQSHLTDVCGSSASALPAGAMGTSAKLEFRSWWLGNIGCSPCPTGLEPLPSLGVYVRDRFAVFWWKLQYL